MRIEHIAIWTKNLEKLKNFYEAYFHAEAGLKYENSKKGFASYFLSFQSGARLEIMFLPDLLAGENCIETPVVGYTHLAISTGSKESVDDLSMQLQIDGYRLIDGPRVTGDGYYESVVLDPDGNRIEITI